MVRAWRWSRGREDPLGGAARRIAGACADLHRRAAPCAAAAGVLNSVLYAISLVPGGEDWVRETEQELAYAGMRQRWAAGAYALFQLLFLFTLLGVMAWFQRGNDALTMLVGMARGRDLGLAAA